MKEYTPAYIRITAILSSIPKGKVSTYGGIAKLAGVPRGARQVSWILNNSTKKLKLPWHRVISSSGKISIPDKTGAKRQRLLLEKEGVHLLEGKFDLNKDLWKPSEKILFNILKDLPDYVPSLGQM